MRDKRECLCVCVFERNERGMCISALKKLRVADGTGGGGVWFMLLEDKDLNSFMSV